jgi:hypothetical protein
LGKPTRGAERLRAMVQVRVNALPTVRARSAGALKAAPIAGQVFRHGRDVLGRNWDIATLANDVGLTADFRLIVDTLRDGFDVEPDAEQPPYFQGP